MLQYDTTIKPGDYVFGYNSGVHKVIEIGPIRSNYYPPHEPTAPLVKLVQLLKEDLTKSPKRKSECDISYCRKITKEELIKWADEAHEKSIHDINEAIV